MGAIKSLVRGIIGACGYRIERIPAVAADFHFRRTGRSSASDDSTVRIAKAHLAQSSMPVDLLSLGDRWQAYASQLRSRISLIASAEELVLLGQSPEAGVETHLPPQELIGYCHYRDLQLLADGLPRHLYDALPSFCSPRVIRSDYVVEYRGRNIDFVSQCSGATILTILNLLSDNLPRTICDIGGGTGTYARSWLTNSAHRADVVAIVDIPETLVYSETLLRTELGDDRVQYISSPTSIPSKSGVILCPIGNIRALENVPFDLVTNTESMQEMTDEWIDWYMAWLDRQPCRFFYSGNYFANALTNMREGSNSWSPRPSSRWRLLHSKVHLGPRNSAEMLFRKDGTVSPSEPQTRGAEAWLAHLDLARSNYDESLRRALDFARSELPFIPKEAWQVAKTLSETTGSAQDRGVFEHLDLMRKTGNEAAH